MSDTNNSEATPTSTANTEAVGEVQKSLHLVKASRIDKFQGCTAIYQSIDSFSSFFCIFIWEIPSDLPPNSEYGFKFMYSVEKNYCGVKVATGYAETLNEACETASCMRRAALHEAVQRYDAPPSYKETLAGGIKKRQFMSRFRY